MADPLHIKVTGRAIQQFDLISQLVPLGLANQAGQLRIIQFNLGGSGCLGVGVGSKVNDLSLLAVIYPLKFLSAADKMCIRDRYPYRVPDKVLVPGFAQPKPSSYGKRHTQ